MMSRPASDCGLALLCIAAAPLLLFAAMLTMLTSRLALPILARIRRANSPAGIPRHGAFSTLLAAAHWASCLSDSCSGGRLRMHHLLVISWRHPLQSESALCPLARFRISHGCGFVIPGAGD